MDTDTVWRVVDAQRAELADLLEDLTPEEWDTASLCGGWRVRDVAAHLTLAHMPVATALRELVRARGGFDRMIHDTAVRQSQRPVAEHPARLRAMAGSRRRAPGVTPVEPMTDLLVHGQDICRPLGRQRPVPPEAAATAATRCWTMGFPFRARRRLHGLRLVATDHDWSAGEGLPVEGPVADLLLLVTGRDVVLPDLAGAGAEQLRSRDVTATGGSTTRRPRRPGQTSGTGPGE